MRVFVAGATGAIGRQLVPLLVAAGHDVAGMTRRPERAPSLVDAGATPVVCDVYDPELADAIAGFAPDVVVHQITDLPQHQAAIALKVRGLNRARTAGTDALVAAARAAGATRFVAQSIAFDVPRMVRGAVEHLEHAVVGYPGVVARYGAFYGPGTWREAPTGAGPHVHVAHAAARTVELLDAAPGIYVVTDDEA